LPQLSKQRAQRCLCHSSGPSRRRPGAHLLLQAAERDQVGTLLLAGGLRVRKGGVVVVGCDVSKAKARLN
jgi:hypothetical protein